MRVLTVVGTVREDHTLTVQVPPDIPPGNQNVVLVMEDSALVPAARPLELTPHPVGPADPQTTYRREEIYGDDGR